MSGRIELWDWEQRVLRSLFYMDPDGQGEFISLLEAAERAGAGGIHPDKLTGLGRKLVGLGYGQGHTEEIQVPSVDIRFKLNTFGYNAAAKLATDLVHVPTISKLRAFDWSALAAVISAIAAIVSAVFAYQATH